MSHVSIKNEILIGGYYKHYKNKMYKVLDVAKHSEELQDYVVYKTLYKNDLAKVWIRPKAMFLEDVMVDGKSQSRFELLYPPQDFKFFHSHIYFNESTAEKAESFYQKFQALKLPVQISKLIHRPIGPHPTPMFEVDFPAENFMEMIRFMQEHRQGLNILVHPLSGSEILDHTDYAMFLGERVDLNLAIFDHR